MTMVGALEGLANMVLKIVADDRAVPRGGHSPMIWMANQRHLLRCITACMSAAAKKMQTVVGIGGGDGARAPVATAEDLDSLSSVYGGMTRAIAEMYTDVKSVDRELDAMKDEIEILKNNKGINPVLEQQDATRVLTEDEDEDDDADNDDDDDDDDDDTTAKEKKDCPGETANSEKTPAPAPAQDTMSFITKPAASTSLVAVATPSAPGTCLQFTLELPFSYLCMTTNVHVALRFT